MKKKVENNGTCCGNLSGAIVGAGDNRIRLGSVALTLDYDTAYALCNVLTEDKIGKHAYLESDQRPPLINLGKALAAFCDHSNARFGDQ